MSEQDAPYGVPQISEVRDEAAVAAVSDTMWTIMNRLARYAGRLSDVMVGRLSRGLEQEGVERAAARQRAHMIVAPLRGCADSLVNACGQARQFRDRFRADYIGEIEDRRAERARIGDDAVIVR